MTAWKKIATFNYNEYAYVEVLVRGQDGVAVAYWDEEENEFITDLRKKGNGTYVHGPVYWMEIPE